MTYPHTLSEVLSTDDPACVRDRIVQDYTTVLELEHLAQKSAMVARVLQDIPWLEYPIVRLSWACAEADKHDNSVDRTMYMARACCQHLGDYNPVENTHQTCRDYQRTRRHKRMSAANVYAQCQHSGALEARGMRVVSASLEEVAKARWDTYARKQKLPNGKLAPQCWPAGLNKILHPQKHWTSCTVPNMFSAALTWMMVRARAMDAELAMVGDSWWSRLLPTHAVCEMRETGDHYMVLGGYVCSHHSAFAANGRRWAV